MMKSTKKTAGSKGKIRGITRIDHPARRTYGWYVRLQVAGKSHSKLFSDKSHGGKNKALEAAVTHLRKLEKQTGVKVGEGRGGNRKAAAKPMAKKVVKKAPAKKAAKKATKKATKKASKRR